MEAFRPAQTEPLPTISDFEWEGWVQLGGGAKLADLQLSQPCATAATAIDMKSRAR